MRIRTGRMGELISTLRGERKFKNKKKRDEKIMLFTRCWISVLRNPRFKSAADALYIYQLSPQK